MDIFYCNCKNNEKFSTPYIHEKQHRAGRYIIEYAAENFYGIKNSEIEIINKKPRFKYSDMHFSVSHSREIAAVCFGRNPLGFDIEKILPRGYKSIAKRMNFSMSENSLDEFYRCWTMYEAEVKLQNKAEYSLSRKFKDEYIFSIASSLPFSIDRIEEIV